MKPHLKYGLLMGVLLAAFPLLLFAIGMDKNESVQSISTVVNLIIIGGVLFVAIKEKRNTEGNGFISFGTGFGHAFKISLIAALVSGVSTYLYFTVINPGMVAFIKLKQEEELMARGMSDEEIAKVSESMDTFMSPPMMVLFSVLMVLILGVVLSLILSAVLKKENPSAMIS